MNKGKKRKFARLYACVMLLLSALLLLISCIPIIRVDLTDEPSEWFLKGSFTGTRPPVSGELNLDMNTAVKAWRYAGELWRIVSLQNLDSAIDRLAQQAETAEGAERASLESELADLRQQRQTALSPEREEALHRLAESGKLDELLRAWDTYLRPAGLDVNIGGFASALSVLRAVVCLAYLAFVALFPVVAAVGLIAKAIYLLLHYRKPDQTELQHLSAVRTCFVYALVNLAFCLMFTLFGVRPVYRAESVAWLAALMALVCLLNAVCKSVFSDEPKEGFWLRQGLRILSFTAVTAAACAVISLGLPNAFLEGADSFEASYIQQAEILPGAVVPDAQAERAVGNSAVEIFAVYSVSSLVLLWLLIRSVRRFASWRSGGRPGATGMIASGVLVLLLVSIPIGFGAGSVEEMNNAAGEGDFRVLWDAYRVEGSEENRLYQSGNAERSALESALAQLDDAVRNSSGEETLKLLEEKDRLEADLLRIQTQLRELKTHQVLDLTVGIIGALVSLIAEWMYWYVSRRGKCKAPRQRLSSDGERLPGAVVYAR